MNCEKTQKGDGKRSPNANPIYEFLKLETLAPISKADLVKYVKEKLASQGKPCADSDVKRILNNVRKTYMVYDPISQLWTGRLYIPESAENKASKGGAK